MENHTVKLVDYIIETALQEHKIITIIYQQDNKFTERNIKITSVKDDTIEAYCYLRHQYRVFRKENILSAALKTNN